VGSKIPAKESSKEAGLQDKSTMDGAVEVCVDGLLVRLEHQKNGMFVRATTLHFPALPPFPTKVLYAAAKVCNAHLL